MATSSPAPAGRIELAARSAGPGPPISWLGDWRDDGVTSAEVPCRGLTGLAEVLQAHGLVGCRAVHHSLQNALDQGQLVAWENPQVLSGQVAETLAALTGEFHQEGGAAGEGKKKPLVTPPGFPPELLDGRAHFPRKCVLLSFSFLVL